ncbi:hypothetical protein PYCC9005_001918 [Savitreella phatthalungensis]
MHSGAASSEPIVLSSDAATEDELPSLQSITGKPSSINADDRPLAFRSETLMARRETGLLRHERLPHASSRFFEHHGLQQKRSPCSASLGNQSGHSREATNVLLPRVVNRRRTGKDSSVHELSVHYGAGTSASLVSMLSCLLKAPLSEIPGRPAGWFNFKRHVTAEYKQELREYHSATPFDILESSAVWCISSAAILEFAANPDDANRIALEASRGRGELFIVMQGMDACIRKSRLADGSEITGQSKTCMPSIGAFEDLLFTLQLDLGALITHSVDTNDSAVHIYDLICEIAAAPYKGDSMARRLDAFCADLGQIPTGADRQDTFEKMLRVIPRIPRQVAVAVAASYDSSASLYNALCAQGATTLTRVTLDDRSRDADQSSEARRIGRASADIIARQYTACVATIEPI